MNKIANDAETNAATHSRYKGQKHTKLIGFCFFFFSLTQSAMLWKKSCTLKPFLSFRPKKNTKNARKKVEREKNGCNEEKRKKLKFRSFGEAASPKSCENFRIESHFNSFSNENVQNEAIIQQKREK